jgi:hypothetical protein
MTDEQIVDDWFQSLANRMDILSIAYEEPIYNFIQQTCEMRQCGETKYYKVNGDWQIIIQKPS